MPEPITMGTALAVSAVLSFFGYLVKKSHDGQKEAAEIALKTKENETEQAKIKQWQEEYDKRSKKDIELDNRIKERDKEVKDIYDKLKQPSLTEKDKKELEEKLAL